jgi:hypothetical protein
MARVKGRRTSLPIGSLTSGSIKIEDSINAMVYEGLNLQMVRSDRKMFRDIQGEWHDLRIDAVASGWTTDDLDEAHNIYEVLYGLLTNYLKPYTYLGTHPDNGADFGVWVDWEGLSSGVKDKEIGRGDCLPSASIIKRDYWMQVNDHGNTTLWRRGRCGMGWRWYHCWGVV